MDLFLHCLLICRLYLGGLRLRAMTNYFRNSVRGGA
jgi:hypothetical protein